MSMVCFMPSKRRLSRFPVGVDLSALCELTCRPSASFRFEPSGTKMEKRIVTRRQYNTTNVDGIGQLPTSRTLPLQLVSVYPGAFWSGDGADTYGIDLE